jgi:aldehyde:ferredoxin oxidoreductase
MRHAQGPLVTIDVTDRTSETTDIDDVLSEFIGGRGVATRLAYDRVPFDADPLGADNRLYFTTGPLQYSTTSFTGRTNATAVSPLTEGLASSNAGGFMSRHLAGTGYSAVEIAGESDELLAVHVTDEGVEFEEVPDLEGATVPEVTAHVEAERGLDAEHIACIGPAGENLVRFASIMTTESRAFGRGGLGAVLGAKNVKAVTFDGDAEPAVEFPDEAMDVHREAATSDSIMKRQGTTSVSDLANEVNGMPAYYWSERQFDGIEGINGAAVEEKKYKKGTCSQCAFACKLPTKDDARGVETEGPEFETTFAFGSNQGVDDIVDVMQSNELCDIYGMDTISCGNTVAAYLASEDRFGDVELVHDLVEKTAHREASATNSRRASPASTRTSASMTTPSRTSTSRPTRGAPSTARGWPTPSRTAVPTTCTRPSTPGSIPSSAATRPSPSRAWRARPPPSPVRRTPARWRTAVSPVGSPAIS